MITHQLECGIREINTETEEACSIACVLMCVVFFCVPQGLLASNEQL